MSNRIVVFSDIQGNSVALNAMFDTLRKLPDFDSFEYVCLGDVASGYNPNAVLDSLREYHVSCVRGNMDDVILNPEPYTGDDEDEQLFNEIDFWASAQLTPINQEFLDYLAMSILYSTDAGNYKFFHGGTDDYNIALSFDTPPDELEKHLAGLASVSFTGHTHQQFMIPVDNKLLINPGSIGFPDPLQNDKRPLRAQFMLLDEGRFEFVTVNYSVEDFTFAVMNSGMPHASWYLNDWDI